MHFLQTLYRKSKKFFLQKKKHYILFGSLAAILLLFLFKACSMTMLEDSHYDIGQDTTWSSIDLQGKERNLTAFNNDLLAAVGKEQGIRFHVYPTNRNQLMRDLERDKLQGVLMSSTPSNVEERHFIFSNSFFLIGPVLVISDALSIEEWSRIPKKIIGVRSNSSPIPKFEKDPTIQLRFYVNYQKALSDLDEHRIDGVVMPAIMAHTYAKTFYQDKLKVIGSPLTQEGIRLIAKKNEKGEELVKLFNEGIQTLKETGLYNEILDRWGFVDVENP